MVTLAILYNKFKVLFYQKSNFQVDNSTFFSNYASFNYIIVYFGNKTARLHKESANFNKQK